MKTNEQQLLKTFAVVLKERANGKDTRELLPMLQRYLSRKDLIEVIKKAHNGMIPAELNLVELENDELVSFIGDEMYIIAYMTEQWCRKQKPDTLIQTEEIQKEVTPNAKPVKK